MGYICEARRETALEFCWELGVGRLDVLLVDVLLVGSGCAEGGTEFKSGAIVFASIEAYVTRLILRRLT
jgi:hypothetical protein